MIDSTRNRNTSFFFSLFYTLSSVLSLYLTFYCIKNPLYLPVASLTLSSMWSITTLITMAHSTSSALVSRLTEMSKTLFLFLLVSDRSVTPLRPIQVALRRADRSWTPCGTRDKARDCSQLSAKYWTLLCCR